MAAPADDAPPRPSHVRPHRVAGEGAVPIGVVSGPRHGRVCLPRPSPLTGSAHSAQQFFARAVEEEVEAADDEVLRRLCDLDQRLPRIEDVLGEPDR